MISFGKYKFVRITRDGAMSHPGMVDGRLVPYLILDCSDNQDIHDLIMLHQDQPPGDVISTWVKAIGRNDVVYLELEFTRPTPAKFMIEFDLTKNLMIVDGILETNTVLIQSNHFGDSIVKSHDKPKILLEITSKGLPFNWDKLFRKEFQTRFRKDGLSKKEAIKGAEKAIEESRRWWKLRRSPEKKQKPE